jgi:hypothetical protein
MSKADDLRKEAKDSGKRGDKTKSLKEGAREHKREKALNDMADNEDWLDGKPTPKPKDSKWPPNALGTPTSSLNRSQTEPTTRWRPLNSDVAASGHPKINCSTVAIPDFVTVTVTGLVEPSVTGTCAPLDEVSNLLRDRMRQDAQALADLLDNVAHRGELGWQQRPGERIEPQFTRTWNGCRRACWCRCW